MALVAALLGIFGVTPAGATGSPQWPAGRLGLRAGRDGRAAWTADHIRFEPIDPAAPLGVTGLGEFHGALELRDAGGGLAVVNDVSFDDYLDGISEMPSTWPAEALRAQAIVARTYALYLLARPPTDPSGLGAQLCASDGCQVYAGLAKQRGPGGSAWLAAVADTQGLVLRYRGAPINAKYSSSNGGRSVDGGQPYLPAVDDPDDVLSPLHRWEVAVAYPDVATALSLGSPVVGVARQGDTIVVTTTTGAPPTPSTQPTSTTSPPPSSAPAPSTVPPTTTTIASSPGPLMPLSRPAVRDAGSAAGADAAGSPPPSGSPPPPASGPPGQPATQEVTLSAEDFTHDINQALPAPADRSVLLPSSRFGLTPGPDGASVLVDGMGFGHGIGMSQYGAYGKALRGMRASDILAAYYGGLRPEVVSGLPARVRVRLAQSLPFAEITGRFRVIDGAGRQLVTVGDGPWTVVPGPGRTLRVVPPDGYDRPFGVDALGVAPEPPVPGVAVAVRYRLPVPALVTVTAHPPTGPARTLPPTTADAGDDVTELPPAASAGEYRVSIAAVAGVGRTASLPLTFTVAATPRAVPDLSRFAATPRAEPARPAPLRVVGSLALLLLVVGLWAAAETRSAAATSVAADGGARWTRPSGSRWARPSGAHWARPSGRRWARPWGS